MTDNGQAQEKAGKGRRWPRRTLAVSVAVVSIVLSGFFYLRAGPVDLPRGAVDSLEARISKAMAPVQVRLGGASVQLHDEGAMRLVFQDVILRDGGGAVLGQVTRASADLAGAALLSGQILPRRFVIDGAQMTMRRDAAGAFTLDFGGSGAGPSSVAETLAALRAGFQNSALGDVAEIGGADLTIALEDARSGRVWQATGGQFSLSQDDGRIELDVLTDVFNGTEDLARLQASLTVPLEEDEATLAVTVAGAAARDLALQSPVLSYLSVLDAPVSGAIRTGVGADGSLTSLAATLEIGAGVLAPGGAVAPVRFNNARAYMTYDPEEARIAFTELNLQSDVLQMTGEGHAYLRDLANGWPQTLEAQLRVSELQIAPGDMFAEPVSFASGRADVRLHLDPFEVTLGQAVLGEGATQLRLSGDVLATPAGWKIGADVAAAETTPAQVLALWPQRAAPGARRWLTRNLAGGTLRDVALALRLGPGSERPVIGASFNFEEARVRFLDHMPPVEAGRGHAALTGGRFALAVSSGKVAEPGYKPVDLAGSQFVVADVFEPVAVAEIHIAARGDLTSTLALLENRPVRVLSRLGRPEDFARADVAAMATIRVPLLKELDAEDVTFDVAARLTDVASDQIVAGRRVTAEVLDLLVSQQGMRLSGPVAVDEVRASVVLEQPFGATQPARIAASVPVDDGFLEDLGIALPPGSLSGATEARIAFDLAEEGPTGFRVTADLAPLRLSLPALGWSKPEGVGGTLELIGRLGRPAIIDRIAIDSPDLSAEGRLLLREDGGLEVAEFDILRLGSWLEAPVTLRPGEGGGLASMAIRGGLVDLRQRPPGQESGGSGAPVPMEVRLDRLVINDAIALTNLRADVVAGAGLSGRFQAQMNGGAGLAGDLVPQSGRTAFRVTGDNAGAVLRDAGLFRSLDDGVFELVMVPDASGAFDGQLRIGAARLGDQPVLADLLDAVSIVGIIDQLQGPGILFDVIDARFRLAGDQLVLEQSSAVGASLGVSLDGVYDTATKQIDMGGVISPVYLLNSIGQIFTRRGEGLFGFTFALTGAADNPRMAVNPLSILTPGAFREIFRRAPPEPQ